jgi:23S rRNA (uridine2479-2'-O)-methyltransferase
VVLFDRPASPGNLGSLIRSCDALGVDGVLVTGHATDVYDPECVRASTGSLFCVPVVRIHQQDVLTNWLAAFRQRWPRVQQVGADEQGPCRLDAHDFQPPTLLLLGNETWGLSAAYRAQCDVLVHIPMQGAASSLNVASAGSILLYEIARQRNRLAHPPIAPV